MGPTPNRLVFGPKNAGLSSRRVESRRVDPTTTETDKKSAAPRAVLKERLEEKEGERTTPREPPWGLPTGKAREDRAELPMSSQDDPNQREQSIPPPIRCRGKMTSTVKDRARAALALWAELDDRGEIEIPRILSRFSVDVIKVARRGERFAELVLETGSYTKAKSSIRSFERLQGAQGSGIGGEARHQFSTAVKRYEERAKRRLGE